jgi:hypothetical protein
MYVSKLTFMNGALEETSGFVSSEFPVTYARPIKDSRTSTVNRILNRINDHPTIRTAQQAGRTYGGHRCKFTQPQSISTGCSGPQVGALDFFSTLMPGIKNTPCPM